MLKWWMFLVALMVGLALNMGGCPTTQVAEHGMAMRGPISANVELDKDGNVTKVGGTYGGGTGSVLHISDNLFYENGNPRRQFLATSDPTKVQETYFGGVRAQSVQDTTNFGIILQNISTTVQTLATTVTTVSADLRAQQQQYSQKTDQELALLKTQQERLDKKWEEGLALIKDLINKTTPPASSP